MKKTILFLLAFSTPLTAYSATLNGAALSLWWGLPFAGLLLSIALFPLLAPHFWHAHFGKVALFWVVLLLAPLAWMFGGGTALSVGIHAFVEEYIPFIMLLTALYTVSGGICLHGNLRGRPGLNVGILALGAGLASIMGTTGAAMLLIRPLLRANETRRRIVHIVVFFIFLVANVGGALSPLGDPPLFLGFLNGVSFFWTTQHLLLPTLFVCGVLLALFYLIDSIEFARHPPPAPHHDSTAVKLSVEGKCNMLLLIAIIAIVLASGIWHTGTVFHLGAATLPLEHLVRDLLLLGVIMLSLKFTPRAARLGNAFNWAPIVEVAKLFAGIFMTIVPVIAMLQAGKNGAFAGLLKLVENPHGQPVTPLYFWATGLLSSFLDNAPTYLVFFNSAGGNAPMLMTTGAATLAAISAGSVFMGGMSYIGNAPNFMVKAIAEARGVKMPSFFGYLLWSITILVPIFLVATWLFFRTSGI